MIFCPFGPQSRASFPKEGGPVCLGKREWRTTLPSNLWGQKWVLRTWGFSSVNVQHLWALTITNCLGFRMHNQFCQVQEKVTERPMKKPQSWKYECLQMNQREQRVTLCYHPLIIRLGKMPGDKDQTKQLWPVRTSGISINLS